jgi:hypothetical protein
VEVRKEGNAKSSAEKKKKKRRAANGKGVCRDLHEDSGENTPCEFCGLKYCSEQSVQNGDCIRGQKHVIMKCVLGL